MRNLTNLRKEIVGALATFKIKHNNITYHAQTHDLTISVAPETDPQQLKQFTGYLNTLSLKYRSSFHSDTRCVDITIY
ncbi:hypothetical protein [Emticicia sp. 17c]|uniref:hypothetical protein n=1 Tax=Emticicia sp. 17c TaxID=3127704 RepID=UPI00301C23D2